MIRSPDWRAVWRTVSRNWMLKLASIAFAVALWGFVNLGARQTDTSMFFPLDVRNLPPDLMITNPLPESVSVRLRGPRTILGTIDPGRQRIQLDLSNVGAGSTSFKLDADLLNFPRGVTVMRVSPVQVTFDVERIVERVLPVAANMAGAVPAGYRVVDSSITPATVAVSGPASEVGALRNISTQPLHLGPAAGSFEETAVLERPADLVRVSPDRVVIRGRLEEIMMTQDYREVEIGVRNPPPQYRLYPRSVDVTVRGPQRMLRELRLGVENFYVDLQGVAPGSHAERIRISLPAETEVIEVRPAVTTVEVEPLPKAARKPKQKEPRSP